MCKVKELFFKGVHKIFDPKFQRIGYDSSVYSKIGINTPTDMWADYELIFKLIDKDGTIVDMGSGCGLLLKFIIENSVYKLVPYGIDLCKDTIKEAKTEILPDYADNFYVGDSLWYNFQRQFTYVLAKPAYVADYEFKWFFNKCYNLLEYGGRLIFVLNKDALAAAIKRKAVMKIVDSKMTIISSQNSTYMYVTKGG